MNIIKKFPLLLAMAAVYAFGQSTSIEYRGRLNDAGILASGSYDLEFKLFDTATLGRGTQKGRTINEFAVSVINGEFTVSLDFGGDVFDGSPRFFEIGVKRAGEAGRYVILEPRQKVGSVPYAINSLNTTFVRADKEGRVGIGTINPFPGYQLNVVGTTLLQPGGGTGGSHIAFGTPNGETGLSITGDGTKRGDLRFDGSTLKLVATDVAGPPASVNGIAITTAGNVGIGTTTPAAGYKLEISGSTILRPANGSLQFGSPNAELGMSITPNAADSRADLRFDGSVLKLLAGPGRVPPSAANGIAITTSGNVGVGTTAPVAKLHAETSEAKAVIYGNATGAGTGVYARSVTGVALFADGNAAQAPDKGGFVKAMAYIDPFLPADRYVVRCYNSQQTAQPAATAPCGIQVLRHSPGGYTINFGFNVQDRFISITAQANVRIPPSYIVGNIRAVTGATVEVQFIRVQTSEDETFFDDSRFHIIVY